MNKLSMFLTGCAALSLVACGNDDLENGGGVDINVPTGDVAYLSVNIKDANATGRSTTSPGFEFGTEEDESLVNNAHFYFFNENGTYAELEAEIWRDGGMNTSKPNDNVEHLGKNVIVLKGLKGTTYPKYMITVINAPVNYKPEATLAATAKSLQQWGASKNFMMTTTSFYGGSDANHTDDYYYANELKPANFLRQAPGTDPDADAIAAANIVNVYVERLAVKVQVKINLKKATGEGVADNLYEIPVTVSGGDNNGNTSVDGELAATKLYAKFTAWGLNATAKNSYLSKNIDGWDATTTFGAWGVNWNVPQFHRSYWAKSVYYGQAISESTLNYFTYNDLKTDFTNTEEAAAAYCNEYTNEADIVTFTDKELDGGVETSVIKVNPDKTTSVLLQAEICDKAGNGLNLVLHNGVLFREEAYIAYVINLAGPYYTKSKNDKGETVFTKYTATTGLSCAATEGSATKILCNTEALGALELYKLKANATDLTKEDSFEAVSVADYATSIETAQADLEATRFNGGKMYYNIPIEHQTEDMAQNEECYYGVVRNHWYKLSIDSLKRLGHAVNNPDKVIIPKPETPEYYLGAQINILSWKVIDQSVSLD